MKKNYYSLVLLLMVFTSEKDNLSEMMDEADIKITELKNNFNPSSSHSKWGVLEKKLTQNLTSFFKSLRLYKEPITNDFLKKLYTHAISSCSDLLEKDFNRISPEFKEESFDPPFDKTELSKLHSLFLKDSPSDEEINEVNENTYSYLLNTLIHDPVTGNFSKSYFSRYLLKECNQEYKVKYISTAFMKLYNTIFSHNATDVKGNEMVDSLLKYLEDEHSITFSKESFSDNPQNYFISLGAGDYLIALPESEEEKIDNDKINDYFSSIPRDTSDIENILRLFCSQDFHLAAGKNCDILLENLANECKELKDIYKLSILDKPMIKDALNNIIYDSTEYYIDTIPNSNDINSKNRFLHLLTKVMLNISIDLNNELTKNSKNKERR